MLSETPRFSGVYVMLVYLTPAAQGYGVVSYELEKEVKLNNCGALWAGL